MNIHCLATSLSGFWGRVQQHSNVRGMLSLLLVMGLTSYHPSTHAQTPLSDILQVAASGGHTCALTTDGGVKCWGSNSRGQLGDGTKVDRTTAVNVSALPGRNSAIILGGYHTCALTNGGGVKCWGGNWRGQLGDGSTTDRLTAVDVSGLSSGVSALAAGFAHTCAITSGGGVNCWGLNAFGQLGNGTPGGVYPIPSGVRGLESGIIAIATGSHHTCAITAGGGVKCWGNNDRGQLGDGSTTNRGTEADVSGLSTGVIAIAAGDYHTCALTVEGGLKCWGSIGAGISSLTPVDLTHLGLASGVSAIAVGERHTCAVITIGGVKCWGNNDSGQLGDGSTVVRYSAVDVGGLSNQVAAIAAGGSHTCALVPGGQVKCWGRNSFGQLGDGTTSDRPTAMDVSELGSGVGEIIAGAFHTCARTADRGLKCWGENSFGQLGDGTTTNRSTAVDVSALSSGVVAIAAGGRHSCALTPGGEVMCWGYNHFGQLGDGTTTDRLTPADVSGLSNDISALSAGGGHTCALTNDGGVKCWGYNQVGGLGDGTTVDRLTAVDVVGLSSGVGAITTGGAHTCALSTTGALKCWGSNSFGQLGDDTTVTRTTAVDVNGLSSGVSAVSAGSGHTCALTAGGGVKCWGLNDFGQLGDGSRITRSTAVDVDGLSSGVIAISASDYHTCALTTAGGVKCWGGNWDGRLGDGTTTERLTAVDVLGLKSGVSGIGAGYGHTCALTSSGGVKCWGSNYVGQLGDGGRNYGLPGDVLTFDVFFNGFESE